MSAATIIVGGGAAGMMAAIKAAESGAPVTLLERNNRLGKKLCITGKGRCNITNSAEIEEFIDKMPGNGQFLYSAFYSFTNTDMIKFLEGTGLNTKIERGGRVFPDSDKAQDVLKVLENRLGALGVNIILNQRVTGMIIENGRVTGIKTEEGKVYTGSQVIIATGGASYPGTGSTGDGYDLAKQAGHTIIPVKPALVPLECREEWIKALQGLALKNVNVTVWAEGRKKSREFGEMLFTHFGISGPVILTLSREIVMLLEKGQKVEVSINLKPALTTEQLDQRFQRDFQKYQRKQLKNALDELMPKSLIPVIINLSGISEDKPVHQISKQERQRLVNQLTDIRLNITGPRPLREAIVTAGGVSVREINPGNMESKLVIGLFFAGEVIDIDGYTGGYNLQAAWSTGYLAGINAAKSLKVFGKKCRK